MTGFLIGVGAAGLRDRTFDNCVVLEFSSSSAFTAVFYVKVPSSTFGDPVVKDRVATVTQTSDEYRLEVALPAGDSIVSVAPVESLWFRFRSSSDESVRKLVKMYSVGSAYAGGIPADGFWQAARLVEVNLPNCTSVGQAAFYGCSALTKFVGGSLDMLYDLGFANCTRLTDFTATRTANICRQVWGGCSALTDLSLPKCSFYYDNTDCIGTLSALQYLRFPDRTLAGVKALFGYRRSVSNRRGVTLVCSDGTQVL